ncbi:MAG TPA: IS21 family transposase [Egibacteraceae bacterium]|jgi:transposase|nr:IS21 family transposase [Egibacteraceae bacterium]
MSRVELYERIRRANRDEGLGIRALALRFRVHRRTIREALSSATPAERKVPERTAPALGPWQGTIRGWLSDDLTAPRKQRHTAHRVWERLTHECGATVAEATVRAYVAKVRFELDNHARAVTVPQNHGPGEEAEVDFGAFSAWIAGVLVELWMFCMRLSHSGRGFHLAFANQAQEAFLEGHVEAFEHFGGVPVGQIRYDNLKPAVIKVLLGRARLENPRFVALRSHYGFDSFYCEPGVNGAHEKGGVEGEIGRFRRAHLVPVPKVASLAELNEVLAAADAGDDHRTVARRSSTVGEMAAAEAAVLRPLPADSFDTATTLWPIVDTKARICVRQSLYSVPAGLSRRRVEVRLGARAFVVIVDAKVVARHQRSLHKGTEDLVLDHYLEILVRKPGALPGSTALAQARSSGAFGATHDAFWEAARRRLGDGAGTRALIGALLLHRSLPAGAVVAGMAAALRIDSVDPDVVAVEARRSLEPADAPAVVVPIGARLAQRPAPTLVGYDELLEAGR